MAKNRAVEKKALIDEIEHHSWFFKNMPRTVIKSDDVVNVGDALIYKYCRTTNLASATTRPYNSQPSETFVETTSEETTFANLASSVAIDVDLLEYRGEVHQWEHPLKSAMHGITDLFNEMVIRGDCTAEDNPDDRAVGPGSFDGLDKIIRNESCHVWDDPDDVIDLSGLGYVETVDGVSRQQVWMDVADQMMYRLCSLRPKPTFILGNYDLIKALSTLARRTGTMEGISLVSMGHKCAKNEDIIPTLKTKTKCRENPDGKEGKTFETKAYVGSFGGDGIIGLELPAGEDGGGLIDIHVSREHYLKRADIEMHIGMAVLSRHACGMFTRICLP